MFVNKNGVDRNLCGYRFLFVGVIRPAEDSAGKIAVYNHKLSPDIRPNRYSAGPFCRFELKEAPAAAGVYAITVSGKVKYIGECENLSTRFGRGGYGYIAARNCHSDGQATNCKVNAAILAAAQGGSTNAVWFHKSPRRKMVEADLLSKLDPPWNGRGGELAVSARSESGPERGARTVADFRHAIEHDIATAAAAGWYVIRMRAGEIHRALGGYPGPHHRLPACCSAMRSLMRPRDRVIESPPSGNGASLVVEYRLPR